MWLYRGQGEPKGRGCARLPAIIPGIRRASVGRTSLVSSCLLLLLTSRPQRRVSSLSITRQGEVARRRTPSIAAPVDSSPATADAPTVDHPTERDRDG